MQAVERVLAAEAQAKRDRERADAAEALWQRQRAQLIELRKASRAVVKEPSEGNVAVLAQLLD